MRSRTGPAPSVSCSRTATNLAASRRQNRSLLIIKIAWPKPPAIFFSQRHSPANSAGRAFFVLHSSCARQFVFDSKAEWMPVSKLLEKVAPGAASFGMNEKSPHIRVYTSVKTGISPTRGRHMQSLSNFLLSAFLLISTCLRIPSRYRARRSPSLLTKSSSPRLRVPRSPQPLLSPIHLPQRSRNSRLHLTSASKTARLSR